MRTYQHLTEEERAHFVQHGWLRVPNAIDPKYLTEWTQDFWVRLGWDEKDPKTWTEHYNKMPRHREVPTEVFCPEAWKKMCEIVGGEDKIDPVRERFFGDQFINSFGAEQFDREEVAYKDLKGWHTDNDWYRQFLDSSGNALTIIHCFTDIPKGGGGTALCEDGIKGICDILYQHPEGLDPPFHGLYDHCKNCHQFAQIEAKAGDTFITHGLLPHSSTPNHLRYCRIITNPHVNMAVPFDLNRPDGDYTLAEQVILRAMGRTSVPEYVPTRPRLSSYPRTAYFKREKVHEELERMLADAKKKGLGPESIDSVYLRGDEAIKEHERRNGYDKPWGPNGVQADFHNDYVWTPGTTRHDVLHSGKVN